ncbi:MAG: hypothetical protein AAGA36_00275 [Pseudomonadota bacterium]
MPQAKLTSDRLEKLRKAKKQAPKGLVCSQIEMREILDLSAQKFNTLSKQDGFPIISRGSGGRDKGQYNAARVLDWFIKREMEQLAADHRRLEYIARLRGTLLPDTPEINGLSWVEQKQAIDAFQKLQEAEERQARTYSSDAANAVISSFMMKLASMFDDLPDKVDPNGKLPPEIMQTLEEQIQDFQKFVHNSLLKFLESAETNAWPAGD